MRDAHSSATAATTLSNAPPSRASVRAPVVPPVHCNTFDFCFLAKKTVTWRSMCNNIRRRRQRNAPPARRVVTAASAARGRHNFARSALGRDSLPTAGCKGERGGGGAGAYTSGVVARERSCTVVSLYMCAYQTRATRGRRRRHRADYTKIKSPIRPSQTDACWSRD